MAGETESQRNSPAEHPKRASLEGDKVSEAETWSGEAEGAVDWDSAWIRLCCCCADAVLLLCSCCAPAEHLLSTCCASAVYLLCFRCVPAVLLLCF